MRFNPLTLRWIMSDKLRLTLSGEIDGVPATVYIYDEDFTSRDEDNVPVLIPDMDVGWPQFIIEDVLSKHNFKPPFRGRSTPASPSNESASSAPKNSGTWECPEHGSASCYPAKFGKGLECNRWQEIKQGDAIPSWANPKVRDVNGMSRVYCSYREFPR